MSTKKAESKHAEKRHAKKAAGINLLPKSNLFSNHFLIICKKLFLEHFRDIAFFVIIIHVLFFVLLNFFDYNSLFSVDMSGHYFSSWYIKEYLFPRAIGWNPFFFFGFPQNQFYQPFLSYAGALLGFIMPIDLGYRILISIIIILTPASFYYFSRSFGLSKPNSAAIMLIMYSLLYAFNAETFFFGGNMKGTFDIGLVPNAAGLMLFFFFSGAINKAFESGKWAKSSLLLAALILTHLMSAIAGILMLFAMFFGKKSKKPIKILLLNLAAAGLLAAFWIVPIAIKSRYINSFFMGTFDNFLNVAILIVAASGLVVFFKKEKGYPLVIFICLLLVSIMIGTMFAVTMHWYRFGMFVLLSIPILVFFLLKKDYSIVCAGALIVMIVAVATGPAILAEGAIAKQFNPLPNNIDGRVLIYTVPWEHDTEHEFQHEIPMLNKVEGARGLYQESSLLARFVYDLELEFNSDWSSAWWYSVDYGAARRLSRETVQEILAAQFNILNINYAISTKSFGLDWTPVKRIITEYKFNKGKTPERYDYVLYKVSDSNLIEVLDYYPEIIPKNEWFELAPVWFLSEEVKNGIFTDEEIPRMIGTGKEKVTILEKSPTMEYIKFRVDSNSAVPILIKISEFPNWRAYKDGKELKIYKAAPGFMLVHSNGTIELKYENTLADDLGNWLSLAGVILVILGIIFPRLINKFKSKQEKEF